MRVFVYGSLKQNCWNHYILKKGGSEYIGEAFLLGYSLYHVASYPGMIKSNDASEKVYGEVYSINKITLSQLDKLEGNGYLYERREVTVYIGEDPIKVYTYIYLPEISPNNIKVKNNKWIGNN